jgi:hypothetical protein
MSDKKVWVEVGGKRSLLVFDDTKIEFVSELQGLIKRKFPVALAAVDEASIDIYADGSLQLPDTLVRDFIDSLRDQLKGRPLITANYTAQGILQMNII